MALLRIKAKEKTSIVWGSASAYFIRDKNITKDVSVAYSNSVEKSFTAGLLLYSIGTVGVSGYLAVRSKDNVTLNGSGNFNITIEHYPSDLEVNKTVDFNIDESPISLNLFYNSIPVVSDIIIETDNRMPYVFQLSDFTDKYTDYDNNDLIEVQINGTVTGYTIDGIALTDGMLITCSSIMSGYLVYTPNDVDAYYEVDNTWEARDSNGNLSESSGNLKIKVNAV